MHPVLGANTTPPQLFVIYLPSAPPWGGGPCDLYDLVSAALPVEWGELLPGGYQQKAWGSGCVCALRFPRAVKSSVLRHSVKEEGTGKFLS